MSKTNNGGPAFPTKKVQRDSIERGFGTELFDREIFYPGMSLRDWFAGKALTGLISEFAHPGYLGFGPDNIPVTVSRAYQIADAMVAEREREGK